MLFSRFFPGRTPAPGLQSGEKNDGSGIADAHSDPVGAPNTEFDSSDGESISSGYDGVKKAQATTIVWTRNALIIAYLLYSATP